MSRTPNETGNHADGTPRKPETEIWPEPTKADRRERLEVLLSWLLLIVGFGALVALGPLL
ncbi:hypothetical protein [Cereibacter sphaeroides]|uniref:hypothetical protein n=1 Tax=Cereibacter sphaeroides TaxID=1063 RepID=UPI001F2EFCC9|nr:hypothetical protein [Cereibacter sphaeroides]